MKKVKVFLIDIVIYSLAFFVIDHFFEDINWIVQTIIVVIIVLILTFIMKEIFHYNNWLCIKIGYKNNTCNYWLGFGCADFCDLESSDFALLPFAKKVFVYLVVLTFSKFITTVIHEFGFNHISSHEAEYLTV